MAQMIPLEPPPRARGTMAERELCEALHHGLGDDWFVYYSLGFLERGRAHEGDVDFLLLHRVHGMLVLECKGGGVRRGADGRWYRGATPMHRSPFAQAQDQVKTLVAELQSRMKGVFPDRFPFVHGHAVAFPFIHAKGEVLPLDVQEDIVLAAPDLHRIEAWTLRALDSPSRPRRSRASPTSKSSR